MIPNNQVDSSDRVRALVDAIKFDYASTSFHAARSYIHATEKSFGDTKMAIVIQEIVGRRLGSRFYPLLSGVGCSYSFYPTGGATSEEGLIASRSDLNGRSSTAGWFGATRPRVREHLSLTRRSGNWRHVRLERPLEIRLDGRSQRGVVWTIGG